MKFIYYSFMIETIGFKGTELLCFNFLYDNFKSFFYFKQNVDIYNDYLSAVLDNDEFTDETESNVISYYTFKRALNSLEEKKLLFQQYTGSNNEKSTMLLVRKGIYYGVLSQEKEDNSLKIINAFNPKYSIVIEDANRFVTAKYNKGYVISFYAEIVKISNVKIHVTNTQDFSVESRLYTPSVEKYSQKLNSLIYPQGYSTNAFYQATKKT